MSDSEDLKKQLADAGKQFGLSAALEESSVGET
jgi:hypothetical protein